MQIRATLILSIPVMMAPVLMTSSIARSETAPKRSGLLTEVTRCQSITAPSERLACYDKAVQALDQAEQKRDVVVVDKEQVQQTRKTLFGLNLPKLGIFGNREDKADEKDEISQIDSTIARADIPNGVWVLTLADGARWRQIDDNVLGRRPKAGDKIVVRRGALGSFKATIAGQPAIKVKREN